MDSLEAIPELDVLLDHVNCQRPGDVRHLTIIRERVHHQSSLPGKAVHGLKQRWSDGRDGLSFNPPVLPEECLQTIAQLDCCRDFADSPLRLVHNACP
jgi:hypothetical protein